jgi:hypothetical protein
MANSIRFKRGGGSLPGSYVGSGEPIWDQTNKKFHVATNTTTVKWVGAEILPQASLDTAFTEASDTTLATSAAIKDYVDAQVTAQDLDFTTDTSGNSSIDLDSQVMTFAGGEGMDVTHSGQTITVAAEDASTSNKGVASFSADNFAASSGAITIKDGGVANAELVNSAVTVTAGNGLSGGGSISLGGSTSIALDLNELSAAVVAVGADFVPIIDATDNSTKKESIADLMAASAGSGITATNGVLALDANSPITGVTGNFTVTGNLVVSGDTVTNNVATVQSEDGLMQLGYKAGGYTSDDVDLGIYGAYSDDSGSTTEYAGIYRDASVGDGVWTFFDSLTAAPGSSTNAVNVSGSGFSYAAIKCADITGVDDDGTGNAELSGFNIDGGTY